MSSVVIVAFVGVEFVNFVGTMIFYDTVNKKQKLIKAFIQQSYINIINIGAYLFPWSNLP